MVMLADTDSGSIVTAAQSGARFGYRLLLVEIALIPVLYLVMELTVRLAIGTGRGMAQLAREHLGRRWAVLAVGVLFVVATGALITEFQGVAGAGEIFGLPAVLTVPAAAAVLAAIVISGSYRRVEVIGLALGSFEIAFIVAAVCAHPNASTMLHEALSPLGRQSESYRILLAANVGAVLMPWMIFYQQSAIVDKKLDDSALKLSRTDTAIGAVVTQLVMIGVLVAAAASLHGLNHPPLHNVDEISGALTPYLGEGVGKIAFAAGITGASLVAAIVVTLGVSWAFSELVGVPRSLDHSVRQAPVFYICFLGGLVTAAGVVLVVTSLVAVSIGVEVANALALPFVLTLLLMSARRSLSGGLALSKSRFVVLCVVTLVISVMGIAVLFSF
jgi:Mn2+/Fe2+ NRAMP family transporter